MCSCYGQDDDEPSPPWTRKDTILWLFAVATLAALFYAGAKWGPDHEGPMFPPNTVEGAAERLHLNAGDDEGPI